MDLKKTVHRLFVLLSVAVMGVGLGIRAQASVDYEFPLAGPTTPTWHPPTPTTVTASSTYSGYTPGNLCNNAGMTGTWYPQDLHDADGSQMWMSVADDASPYVEIDLGGIHALGKMLVWNFNAYAGGTSYSGRGVRTCSIEYSTDDSNWTQLGGPQEGGQFELAQASSTGTPTPATNQSNGNGPVDFKGAPARYVRISALSNWGGAGSDGSTKYYGLGQVRIYRHASEVGARGRFISSHALQWSSASAPAEDSANNLGMSDAGSGVYLASATADTSSGWMSGANDPSPYIILDLGGTYPLAKMVVWNLNVNSGGSLAGRGVKDATIYYSVSNPGYNPDDIWWPFRGWTKLVGPNADQTWTFNHANGVVGQTATDIFSFNDLPVRYVMIVPNMGNGNGNWGGAPGDSGNAYYGLTQVRFYAGVGMVAEPALYWTGLSGQRSESGTATIWAGADGGYSLPYRGPSGAFRTLFTYSDTFKSNWSPTTYQRLNWTMPNNSNGVYSGGATLTPALTTMGLDTSHTIIPWAQWPNCFYWLNGGAYIDSRATIFVMGPRGRMESGNYVRLGSSMISLPVSNGVIQWASQGQYDMGTYYEDPVTGWFADYGSCMLDSTAQDGYVYIYGLISEPPPPGWGLRNNLAIVGRCTPAEITNFGNWRFYNGTDWVSGFLNSAPISQGGAGLTYSVTPAFDAAHAGQFLLTTMGATIGPVQIAYGPTPWGPFGAWTVIYPPPENDPDWMDGGVWWYCAMHHPEISLPGEAMISYSINAFPGTSNNDLNADIYHPRFIRVRRIQRPFADVPDDYWSGDYIEAIAAAGITLGCVADDPETPENEAQYCPEQTVNRAQMALYIGRAIGGLPDYAPAPCGEERFEDVGCDYLAPGNPPGEFYRGIEYIADAEGNSIGRSITIGCIADEPGTPENEARYCPEEEVNRLQMAVYIGRALGGLDEYNAAPCGEERFTDVLCGDYPTEFYKAVEYIADGNSNPAGRAITIGCEEGSKYCPDGLVTRAAMAVYIARAFLGID